MGCVLGWGWQVGGTGRGDTGVSHYCVVYNHEHTPSHTLLALDFQYDYSYL